MYYMLKRRAFVMFKISQGICEMGALFNGITQFLFYNSEFLLLVQTKACKMTYKIAIMLYAYCIIPDPSLDDIHCQIHTHMPLS